MIDQENNLETNKLTKELLEKYIETNVDYYEKFREKFNIKNNFLSWNWSFFFFIPWLAYRKIWGYYVGFVIVSFVFASFAYKLLTAPHDLSPVLMIIAGLAILVFAVFSSLTVNNQVLKRARENVGSSGKSSLFIVFLATLLLVLPNLIAMAKVYPVYKRDVDRNTIFHIREDDKNLSQIFEKINGISKENINSFGVYAQIGLVSRKDLISRVVCHDNVQLLELIAKKDATFSSTHLDRAARCGALNSVKFLLDNGVRVNAHNYEIVQDSIVYQRNIPLATLLLSNEIDLSGNNNAQILIEQAINLEESPEKKEFIEYLLSKKIDIENPQDNSESSALYEAIIRNDYGSTKLLLDRGANPNQRYKYGRTPLYKAIYESKIEIVRLLLEYKADPSLELDDKKTVLDHAVQSRKVEKIRLLLKFIDVVDPRILTMVMKTGDNEIISLFDKFNTKREPSKEEVAELFSEACTSKNTKGIDLLLEKGYDINSSNYIVMRDCGAWKGIKMFEYVLSKGADVNLFSREKENGRNILHNIISGNNGEFTEEHWKQLKLVLKYEVNVNHQDNKKRTPLMWALYHGRSNVEVVEYLLDNTDVDLALIDENNESLLHYVLNLPSVMEKIIYKLKKEQKLELIDLKNSYGATPLHYAAATNSQVVKLLLDAGAKTNIVNSYGFTPLANIQNKESYKLLMNTGNDISKKKAKCKISVEMMGLKDNQSLCLDVAKHETNINNITYYQWLGGDISGLTNTTFDKKQGVARYLYALANVGHGLIINKELEQAKIKYAMFFHYSVVMKGKNREEVDKTMQADFEILAKLYGATARKDAQSVWESIKSFEDTKEIVYKEAMKK